MCEIIHWLLSANTFYSLEVQNQLSICSLQLLKHFKVFLLFWLKQIIYSIYYASENLGIAAGIRMASVFKLKDV